MRIIVEPGNEPQAGMIFQFGVEHTVEDRGFGPISVMVTLNNKKEAFLQCPDPPCHEMTYEVDDGLEEARLELSAMSDDCEPVHLAFLVGNPRPRPQAMAG